MSILNVEHLSHGFGDRAIFEDVSFRLLKGEHIGLVGANGSGKSVLFKILCGFEKPDSGSVSIRGKQLGKNGRDFPENVGVFINAPGFIGMYSGLQNLKFLADIQGKISETEIREAMGKVGLDPENKTKVSNYSLGMKQKLGLAQAIMEGQDILVLDDASSALDYRTDANLRHALNRAYAGVTTIIVAQRVSSLAHADLILVLEQGRCIGAGDNEQAIYYTKKLLGWAYLVMGVLNGLILIFVRPLVGIYELSGETMELSIILACIHAGFAMLLWPLSFVLPNALRAANDVKFTMIVSIASMACWRVGFSYIIGVRMGMGAIGVWIAMVVDWVCRVTCFVTRFRSGVWKEKYKA